MKSIAVKFCGGCNTRYDRGAAYQRLRAELEDVAEVSLVQPDASYDALVIFRGCTGCDYLYEDIPATERLICLGEEDLTHIIQQIKAMP